jgi:glycosidase
MTNYAEHYEKRDYIYPLSRNEIFFKFKTNIESVKKIEFIYFEKIRKREEKSIELENFNLTNSGRYYFGTLKYEETIKYIDYFFRVTTISEVLYYSPEGLRKQKPRRSFCYSDTNYCDVFITPKWANGLIGYQIFPDRFSIGKELLIKNPSDWEESPTRENFFGGNILGIIDKISYLSDLNVGIVYLTPVFKSYSNHKYDTVDYFDIDPSFGTKEDFELLVEKLHEAGIKIIIDGVFNHIGYYSKQFQDVIQNGRESSYYNWFYIDGDAIDTDSVNYECVGYYKWMPKLNYRSLEVRSYIKSVGKYWLKNFSIDGYRLDVADEVDYTFWQEFRRTVKKTNAKALIIGESWKNGSDLLRGDTLDSIMNYRLRDALLDFIVDEYISLDEFKERIESIYFDYPKQTHNLLYNTLGSHDTDRIITLCKDNVEKTNLLVSMLFNYPGIPFIYYGDEIGTTGENDPLSRKTMDWNKTFNETHLFYLNQTEKKTSSEVMKYGDFKHIDISKGIYSFVRTYNNDFIIFLANISKTEKIVEVNYQGIKKEITLSPYESEIIKK